MNKLTGIQHLRAFAAMLVVFGHIASLINTYDIGPKIFELPSAFGVDVFFVLSGFIMYYTARGTGPAASGDFMRRRILRIVPIYWIMSIVETAILVVSRLDRPDEQVTFLDIARSFFFIPYENAEGKFRPLLGVGWTLHYEMFFYVLFALALLVTRRAGMPLLFALMIGLVFFGEVTDPEGAARFWTAPIILEFLLGILIGMAFKTWPVATLPAWAPIPFAIACTAVLSVIPDLSGSFGIHWRPTHWLVAAAVVVVGAFAMEPRSESAASKFFTALGNSSYSIYLTHSTVGTLGLIYGYKFGILQKLTSIPVYIITVTVVTIAGWLFYVWVEDRITMALKPRPRPVTAPSPA